VLARENAALAALDFAAATALLPAKQEAAEAFARAVEAEAHAPADRATAERLQILVEENRRRLEHAIRLQGRVLGLLAQALRPPVGPRYGMHGLLRDAAAAPVIVSARA
jgi:hypothetical protein